MSSYQESKMEESKVEEIQEIDYTEDIKEDDSLKTMILKMNHLLNFFIDKVEDLQKSIDSINNNRSSSSESSEHNMGEKQKTSIFELEKDE